MLFNFVQQRRWFYLLSGAIILAGLVAMGISLSRNGSIVRLGLDFTGGSLFEVRFKSAEGTVPADGFTIDDISGAFTAAGLEDVRVQQVQALTGGTDDPTLSRWQVRTKFVEPKAGLIDTLGTNLTQVGTDHALTFDGDFFRTNQQTVSPAIGNEVTTAAIVATVIASLLVLGFIAVAFRQVTHSVRYGACAVIAMVHDVLIMIGVMSILGLLLGWEADALFLTGLLTVVGYSVQDSIVVFDRIRENSQRHRTEPFELIVNRSIAETLQRSITTQICVAFVLLALFLMGSGAIRQFVGVLLIGLVSGTYSSIGVAIPLLVSWERGEIPFVNQQAKLKAKTA
jgi:preprotein translocase SecF subunit